MNYLQKTETYMCHCYWSQEQYYLNKSQQLHKLQMQFFPVTAILKQETFIALSNT